MPIGNVHGAIEYLGEYVAEEMAKDHIVPPRHDQVLAKVAQLLPGALRQVGRDDLADLAEQDPQKFKSMKEEGERLLIGRTYEEEDKATLEEFFGGA